MNKRRVLMENSFITDPTRRKVEESRFLSLHGYPVRVVVVVVAPADSEKNSLDNSVRILEFIICIIYLFAMTIV